MSYFFNDSFRAALKADPSIMDGAEIEAVFFPIAPAFPTGSDAYSGINNVDDLASTLGWGDYITDTVSQTVSVQTVDDNNYVMLANPFDLPDTFETSAVSAIAFVYKGPDAPMSETIIFVTNRPLGGVTILNASDAITSLQDEALTEPNNRWLFSWAESDPAAPLTLVEGQLALLRGPGMFEQARLQHVWVYPQRINFIANPSFETGVEFWRWSDTGSPMETIEDVPYGAGNLAGHTESTVIESNMFPLNLPRKKPDGWTIQAKIRSDGEIKVGLIAWEPDFLQTYSDWGPVEEQWLPNDGWIDVRTCRFVGDVTTGLLRIETDGSYIDIDQVCVEPGIMPTSYDDWPYFDGSSLYGTVGDFSWYNEPHGSYSFWYNNRSAVMGRLFSWGLDTEDQGPGAVITDEETVEQGLVYQWVPAGTPVQEHLDVLYPYDPRSPIPSISGNVLEYKTGPDDEMGVTDPWAA